MKIYTGRGDEGLTDLRTGDRVPKSSRRIEAYGVVDEANAYLGHAATEIQHDDVRETVLEVQEHLFKAQAVLANPGEEGPSVREEDVEWLEGRIDGYQEELPAIDKFILPGGGPAGSTLHVTRTVARRAERRVVALTNETDEDHGEGMVQKYLNRLSDLLFVLARTANHREGEEEHNPSY